MFATPDNFDQIEGGGQGVDVRKVEVSDLEPPRSCAQAHAIRTGYEVHRRLGQTGSRQVDRLELVERLLTVQDAKALRHKEPFVATEGEHGCADRRELAWQI